MAQITRDDLVGHGNFVMVRPSLVKALGGKTGPAIVLSAIEFQISQGRLGELHDGPDGTTWWRANMQVLADWTGMSVFAVQRAIAALIKDGVLVKDKRHRGRGDHTYSYAIVLDGQLPDVGGEAPEVRTIVDPAVPQDHSAEPQILHSAEPQILHSAEPQILPVETGKTGGEGQTTLPLRFPTQCSKHQDDYHDEPCHGCRRARESSETAVVVELPTPLVRCDVHQTTFSIHHVCGGCRIDAIVGDR